MLYMAEVWSGSGGGVEGVFSRPNGWESAEPDSGDHLYAAATAELNTDAAAVTLDTGQQIFFPQCHDKFKLQWDQLCIFITFI